METFGEWLQKCTEVWLRVAEPQTSKNPVVSGKPRKIYGIEMKSMLNINEIASFAIKYWLS
jgi:hypothetical protein